MSDALDQPESGGWGLVLPFVVCRSQGGPYDDDSFVAGFQAGQVYRALAAIAAVEGDGLTATVRADLGKQLDLIAMHHGFQYIEHDETFRDERGMPILAEGWMTWRCSRTAMPPGSGS